jgi:FixJ family two-component response regulator
MTGRPSTIAIVDDEPRMRSALSRLLRVRGYSVVEFGGGAGFLAALETASFACVILDLHMPGINGFEVLDRLAGLERRPPVVVITGHDQPGTVEQVERLGAHAYLMKPVDETPLMRAIESAVAPPTDAAANGH